MEGEGGVEGEGEREVVSISAPKLGSECDSLPPNLCKGWLQQTLNSGDLDCCAFPPGPFHSLRTSLSWQ